MIRIGRPLITTMPDGAARLSADVVVDGIVHQLWYEVEEKYRDGLCADRCDAFVAGLLYFAMCNRHDIGFDAPITWEMKVGIERDFLDVVCENLPGKRPYHVKLVGETVSALVKTREACATGISCGVDSLYAVKRRLLESPCSLRYLVLNDLHGAVKNDDQEKHGYRWNRLLERARSFSVQCKLPLIVGKTNFNAGAIPGLSFEDGTTFGNMFCALALQGLFTDYYLASGGPLENFRDCINRGIFGVQRDDYDLLTLAAFSTRSLKFVSDGLTARVNKMRELSKWPMAQKYLDVCHVHAIGNDRNGTYDCPKCMHTVVELMALGPGVLDQFSAVFDVDYVKTHKHEFLAELMRRRLIGVQSAKESWPFRCNMGFSWIDYFRAVVIVTKKAIKKVIRIGKVSQDFSPRG